jgi:hypothetical protein
MLGNYFGFFHGVLTILWKKPVLGETRALAIPARPSGAFAPLATLYWLPAAGWFSACHEDFGDAAVTKVHCEAALRTSQ